MASQVGLIRVAQANWMAADRRFHAIIAGAIRTVRNTAARNRTTVMIVLNTGCNTEVQSIWMPVTKMSHPALMPSQADPATSAIHENTGPNTPLIQFHTPLRTSTKPAHTFLPVSVLVKNTTRAVTTAAIAAMTQPIGPRPITHAAAIWAPATSAIAPDLIHAAPVFHRVPICIAPDFAASAWRLIHAHAFCAAAAIALAPMMVHCTPSATRIGTTAVATTAATAARATLCSSNHCDADTTASFTTPIPVPRAWNAGLTNPIAASMPPRAPAMALTATVSGPCALS